MTTDCVFCKIVAGTAPATIVQEWRDALAIEPLTPVAPGHVLIIPKNHTDDALQDTHRTGQMMKLAAEFAQTRPWTYASCNILTSIGAPATQSIRHLHVHVVPRKVDDGLMLPWGTIYGDDPTAPHWCRVAQGLREALLEVQAVQQELNATGNPILQSAAGRLNGVKAHLWTPEELAARGIYRG